MSSENSAVPCEYMLSGYMKEGVTLGSHVAQDSVLSSVKWVNGQGRRAGEVRAEDAVS